MYVRLYMCMHAHASPRTSFFLAFLFSCINLFVHIQDLFDYLNEGHRLKAPENTPTEVYNEIMWKCWHRQPKERLTFSDIVTKLTAIHAELLRR